MARRPKSARDLDDAARAKRVADKYFDLDSSSDRSVDDEDARRHLDDGYPEGRARPTRRAPASRPPAPKPKPVKLTPKQLMFVTEYLVDLNGTQAAIRAGYAQAAAHQTAYENLRKPEIRAMIEHGLKERAQRATWNADMVLARLGQELTADIADLFDDAGNLKAVKDWPMIFRTGLVAGFDVEEITNVDADGDLVPGIIRKIKLSDRTKRLELLGKHVDVQAWKERKEVDVPKDSPLAQLAKQLEGTAIRPRLTAPEGGDE